MTRRTLADLHKMAAGGEKITMITAYDYTSAQLVERAELPLILVGDSLGMVVQGHENTIPVTLDDMVYHTRMVTRGCQTPLVVADLPFLSYPDPQTALRAAGRLLREGGAQSVKLEGGAAVTDTIATLVGFGVPVMAHLGFTPQSVHQLGTRVQGKQADAAAQLLSDALAVQAAGAWAVVLELVPAPLAEAITAKLDIPTIGIGAGAGCDGQVQVWHDLLGLLEDFVPRHARQYRQLGKEVIGALREYRDDVTHGRFPTAQNAASMPADELQKALRSHGGALPRARNVAQLTEGPHTP